MTETRLEIGRAGESAALAHYVERGYRLVARNWRCRLGELDLVVVGRDGTLVFCEVKCRRGSGFGGPFEAVHRMKQRKVRDLAEAFLGAFRGSVGAVRFDVASVTLGPGSRTSVHLFEDAF